MTQIKEKTIRYKIEEKHFETMKGKGSTYFNVIDTETNSPVGKVCHKKKKAYEMIKTLEKRDRIMNVAKLVERDFEWIKLTGKTKDELFETQSNLLNQLSELIDEII